MTCVGRAGVKLQNSAANSVPARLATSTIPTSHHATDVAPVNSAATGKTAVIVLSVNNC
jgi:hypothetical protein